jgi:hypothetical protein
MNPTTAIIAASHHDGKVNERMPILAGLCVFDRCYRENIKRLAVMNSPLDCEC